MKKIFKFVIILNILAMNPVFSQTMNIFTKTGVTSIKLSDIDSINFASSTTSAKLPVLSTTAVSSVTVTNAVCGGNVTSDGGLTVTARGVCWSTGSVPTITNNKTVDGSGKGIFTSKITGLSANTTYYACAYATNSEGTSYGSIISFKTQSSDGKIVDADGNVYNYVNIGKQVWMVENLRTTKYRNGDAIKNVAGDGLWSNLSTGAYCYYDNNSVNAATYGFLYNYYAISDSRGLAPVGWHVPADSDWTILINYLEGDNSAGGKLKETGTLHWMTPNMGATNETGFLALPSGGRETNGVFIDLGSFGNWWSSTEISSAYAYCRHLYYNYGGASRIYKNKKTGFAVRCIKD